MGGTGKGGKNRRRGKNENEEKRELVFKEDGQGAFALPCGCGGCGRIAAAATALTACSAVSLRVAEYAKVLKMLGNGHLDAYCYDGVRRMCHIRGKMRKKVWVGVGDIILVGLREYQDSKADVMLKFSPDEARNLKLYGELPDTAKIGVDTGGEPLEDALGDNEDAFEFDVDDVRAHAVCTSFPCAPSTPHGCADTCCHGRACADGVCPCASSLPLQI